MYPFPFIFSGAPLPPVPGIVKKLASAGTGSSDVGGSAMATTGGIKANLYAITTDGRLLKTGVGSTYGSWTLIYPDIDDFVSIASDIILVRTLSGTYRTVGINPGTTGLGTVAGDGTWTYPVDMTQIKDVAFGSDHVFVLLNDGTVWGGGNNLYGALGKSGAQATPYIITTGATEVYSSGYFTGFYKKNNTLYASGYNYYGLLMNGGTTNRTSFVNVSVGGSTANVAQFSVAELGVKIVTTSGDVYTAGQGIGNPSGATLTSATLVTQGTQIPADPSGYQVIKRNSGRAAMFLRSGDGAKFYASSGLGRGVGLAAESGSNFVSIFPGLDHSLTTDAVLWAGGCAVVNNGFIYTSGVDRPWRDPNASTPTIIMPLQAPPFPIQ